jgi:DNA (cytosine-5)-methyltransferase 1
VGRIRAIDLFCGAGGSSWGAQLAGVEIVAGFDVWNAAKEAFHANFPKAHFFDGFLEDLNPNTIRRKIGAIDLIIASPECRSHSLARGAGTRSGRSRDTALQVARFAAVFKPRWIVIENVVTMRSWAKYARFKRSLEGLGYKITEQVLNAADFGVPQQRRRLFLLCDKKNEPAKVRAIRSTHSPISNFVDLNGTYEFSPLRTEKRAAATLERADRAISALGSRPFLLVYYGTDRAGGWQSLGRTLRTITTLDRFALVKPNKSGHVMRMLQVPELKRAMGMPMVFDLGTGSRRQRIHLIGNAVCPPVMRSAVRSLVKKRKSTKPTRIKRS